MTEKVKKPVKKKVPAKKVPAKKNGKPGVTYSIEIVNKICDQLERGITLVDILKQDGYPAKRTVYDWIDKYPEAASLIARARDIGYDAIANSCLEIADNASADRYTDEKGCDRIDTEVVQRSKLRIWTRLELLKKWDPKRYGDSMKIDANVTVSRADAIRKARERAGKK